jgi:hypothetical protein
MFQIHVKVRHDENFVLRTINLLTQLVSMNRPVQTLNRDIRLEFLSNILSPFTALLNM